MIPVAEGITIEGSPVIGETLTGRYGTYTDATGRPEGNSYCVWSCADDPGFTQNVTELQSEPIRAGGTSVYAPAENEIGKYIRFSVIPVAEGAQYHRRTGLLHDERAGADCPAFPQSVHHLPPERRCDSRK